MSRLCDSVSYMLK